MAYNYEYPYTDPNRFNSDWLLSEMKRVIAEWAETLTEWNGTREEWEALRAYVAGYFDNLDVQEEINTKLDQMAEDGSLLTILQPYINSIEEAQDARIDTLESRVAQIVENPGSTSGDLALADIQIPYSQLHGGVAYDTPGDAVRGQAGELYQATVKNAGDIYDLQRFFGHSLACEYGQFASADIEQDRTASNPRARSVVFRGNGSYTLTSDMEDYTYTLYEQIADKSTSAVNMGVFHGEMSADLREGYLYRILVNINTAGNPLPTINLIDNADDILGKINAAVRTIQSHGYPATLSAQQMADLFTNWEGLPGNTIACALSQPAALGAPYEGFSGTVLTASNAYLGGDFQLAVDRNGAAYIRIKWGSGGVYAYRAWKHLLDNDDIPEIQSAENYCDLSMFEKIGGIGDSYMSGSIFLEGETSGYRRFRLSWLQDLARYNGIEATNYSYGGLTTRTWLGSEGGRVDGSGSENGLAKFDEDVMNGDTKGLYIICLGGNDSSTAADKNVPLGSAADIKSDYTTNPDTFYGNYGYIVDHIRSNVPGAKIVISTFRMNDSSMTAQRWAYNEAIKEIGDVMGVPVIDLKEDGYFSSDFYLNGFERNHPTAVTYNGYARAMQRLISRAIVNNFAYFKDYLGEADNA